MDVGTPLVANGEAAEAIEPGERALDDPTMPAQLLTRVDAFAGNADPDVATAEGATAAGNIVGLVGMDLGGTLASPAVGLLDPGNGVEQWLKDHRLVAVGPRQECGEREAGPLDHNMALRARFAAIRWVRPDGVAPLLAGILAESRAARLQSMWSASPSRSSKVWWSRSQTPASCQSRNLRQH